MRTNDEEECNSVFFFIKFDMDINFAWCYQRNGPSVEAVVVFLTKISLPVSKKI